MLKNIDPILTGDLLAILRNMGHGDEIVVTDANFPATAVAQRIVRLPGLAAAAALEPPGQRAREGLRRAGEAGLVRRSDDEHISKAHGQVRIRGKPAKLPTPRSARDIRGFGRSGGRG